MENFGMRRKIFLELCEKHDNIIDDPFNWGTFKMFYGRAMNREKCVEDFLKWKEKSKK